MKNFIVAYDIFNIKRLSKIKKIVYSYALGGQKSALEVPLDKILTRSLLDELTKIIKDEDKVNIIKIDSSPILLGKASKISYENNGVIII